MSIGTNIRELRKSKGWTQVELAQKLNMTQQAITAYERGKKRPPVDKCYLPHFHHTLPKKFLTL